MGRRKMNKTTKYGLQLRVQPQQKKKSVKPPLPTLLGFVDSDDDNVEREILRQAYKNKSHKDIEEQHKKTLEEGPSTFDYDGVYDKMKEKQVQPMEEDRKDRKPPTQSAVELSSGSGSPLDHSPLSDDEDSINLSKLFEKEAPRVSDIDNNDDAKKPVKGKSPQKNKDVKQTPGRKRKNNDDGTGATGKDAKRRTPQKRAQPLEQNNSIWSLSLDSEASPNVSPDRKDSVLKKELFLQNEGLCTENKKDTDHGILDLDEEPPTKRASKVKYPRKKLEKEKNTVNSNGEDGAYNNVMKEDLSGKHPGHQVSYSRVPLLLSDKVQRTKALVECEGDSINLSGDVGAVGRVVISDDPSGNHEMFLDLKGTIYKTAIVPSRTFCVVNFSQSEAKIEAIMNDFIQLKPQSNIYEAETMVEGTLDGFSFGSEDEADDLPKATAQTDLNEAADEQREGKTKRKAKKTSGASRKTGKSAVGKPNKKVKRKAQVPKERKTKK